MEIRNSHHAKKGKQDYARSDWLTAINHTLFNK